MSPFVNNTLDPDIWDNSIIRPHIRASLLRIAAEFLIGLNIEVSPKDITLTGSMANFNYNPQSDLDLHVVIGFSDVDNDVELVKQFLIAKKSLWNLKHQITVKGHDVEVYPQDNNEPHHSTGVYSLLNNEWLVKPTRDDPNIDPATVEKKFNSLAAMIDGILGMPDRINHIASVREKLGAMRKLGLSKAGEFSVENLAFKKLRREGYLDRLASAQLQDRDASLSIAEEGYKMKITKRQLRRIIKEELSLLNESSPSDLYNRLVHLRNEHQGEFALLDTLGEDGFKEVMRIRDEVLNSELEGYGAYTAFFGRVKQSYGLFPNVVRNLWDERHEMPDIEALKVLKAEHDDLDNKFESRGATNTTDSMYGRKRTEVVHTGTGEVVSTGVDRKGSLGT